MVGLAASFVFGLFSPGSRAAAADPATPHVLVVEDDGHVLEPANPFPLANRRLRLTPSSRGYATTIAPATHVIALGEPLELGGADSASAHVVLRQPVELFGHSYLDLFVHPQGVVSLGGPLPGRSAARAAESGELLSRLMGGPPVIAALWNDLNPTRAEPGGGVFLAEYSDRVVVSWVAIPSARPAGQPNSFRVVLYHDGVIDLEYGAVASQWGIVGVSPGPDRERIRIVELGGEGVLLAGEASFAWYHDLPTLNEIALARHVYASTPDVFQFLTVFTLGSVDGPSLVRSTTVKNLDEGIGMPVFDHASVFGSRKLEHIVVMNDLAFYDPDPHAPPRASSYGYAPSTVAVLAHESGHRWLAHLGGAGADAMVGSDGHWNFFLDSGGSFMGGNALRDNADGSFTTTAALSSFGPLDQYLMGLLPPGEVGPFFMVEQANGFSTANPARLGHGFDLRSHPETGVTFRGKRRDLTVDDIVARAGRRVPDAVPGERSFRMAFILVVPAGAVPTPVDLAKVDAVRRAFSPLFRDATGGRARMRTWLRRAQGVEDSVPSDPLLLAGQPRVLDAKIELDGRGRNRVALDLLDFDADTTTLEVSTDATLDLPPTVMDLTSGAYGARRSSIRFALRDLPAGARSLRLALVDRRGMRSDVVSRPLPAAAN